MASRHPDHKPLQLEISPMSPMTHPSEFVDPNSDSDGPPPNSAPPPASRRSSSRDRDGHHTHKGGSQSRSQSRRPAASRGGYASDYDGPRSSRSTRPLRPQEQEDWEEEEYYERERDRDYWRDHDEAQHPDRYTRRPVQRTGSRPPRAWRNRPIPESEFSPSPSKPYFEETHSQRNYRIPDEEMGQVTSNRVNWKELSSEEKAEVLRLPWSHWMNSNFKNHFVASMGEFIGTTMFLLFAFAGTEVANIQSQATDSSSSDSNTTTGAATGFNVSVLLYISVIFGFSLMVNVWVFFRISGGLFNPAVTLAMVMVKAIPPVRAICLFVAQMLGSMLASVIVRFLFPENFNVRTTLSTGTSLLQGVFIEAILTAELVFTIIMLAKEKHKATFIAPVGIGLALFIAEMVGVEFTGGSLNPARSFGPCVITLTFDQEHWIYWVGPFIGALLAVAFYRFIKTLEYEVSITLPIYVDLVVDGLTNCFLRWQTLVLMVIQATILLKTQRRERNFAALDICRRAGHSKHIRQAS
jgi:aquaporin related protein